MHGGGGDGGGGGGGEGIESRPSASIFASIGDASGVASPSHGKRTSTTSNSTMAIEASSIRCPFHTCCFFFRTVLVVFGIFFLRFGFSAADCTSSSSSSAAGAILAVLRFGFAFLAGVAFGFVAVTGIILLEA